MKRLFYSELSRVFLTILLLFSSMATVIYSFLTFRAPLLYGSVETVTETLPYSRLFSKYVERTAVYTRYLEDGYTLKYTELSPELELLLEGEMSNEDLQSALLNVYRPSETAFYYYHVKLNVEPTNFMYYVVNQKTGTFYCPAGFEEYAAKKSGSVEAFLSSGILQEPLYLILNTQNNRTMTGGGNPSVLNRSNLLWSMDFMSRPLSELAEDIQYDYNYNVEYKNPEYIIEKEPETDESTHLNSIVKEEGSSESILPDGSGVSDVSVENKVMQGTPMNSYLLYAFVADTAVVDEFSHMASDFTRAQNDYHEGLIYTTGFLLLTLFLFFLCNLVSGHRANAEGITLRVQDKLPTELFLLGVFFMILLPAMFLSELHEQPNASITSLYNNYRSYIEWVPLFIACLSVYLMLFGFFYFSLIRRLKARIFIRSSFVGRYILHPLKRLFSSLINGIKEFLHGLPAMWITALQLFIGLVWLILSILVLLHSTLLGCLMLFLEFLYATSVFMHNAIDHQHIIRGAAAMATGNLSARISADSMLPSNRKLSEDINHICDGLHYAVEEQTKSERMKTELITNVSHDIKTPLTSIINYIELLKNELPKDGPAVEYAEVLSQKSWRLKSLIDDLVEASKVSSGTIRLEPISFNAAELLRQVVGDFEERLESLKLTVVMNLPDTPVNVFADGAATHRIIENLFSNICKYALSGTRVFITLDLPEDTGLALLTIKNTSASLLTKSPEELLTRFTRDNDARSGEGSGLGLSIAESLAKLQGGSFYIEIDEDIFKAKLTLPLAKSGNSVS